MPLRLCSQRDRVIQFYRAVVAFDLRPANSSLSPHDSLDAAGIPVPTIPLGGFSDKRGSRSLPKVALFRYHGLP
jgi:hypothetical protein